MTGKTEFQNELEQLINRHSMENGSDTPDFILAEYLVGCLKVYDATIEKRCTWYGQDAPHKKFLEGMFRSRALQEGTTPAEIRAQADSWASQKGDRET